MIKEDYAILMNVLLLQVIKQYLLKNISCLSLTHVHLHLRMINLDLCLYIIIVPICHYCGVEGHNI